IGSTKSSGFEFSVLASPVRNRTFTLDVGYNLTYIIQYKITKLQLVNDPTYLGAEVGSIGINGFIQRNTVGYRLNMFFLYKEIYTNIFTGQNYLNNGTLDLLSSNFTNRQTWSDYYLQNASFLRMDNAYINYNVGKVIRGQANLRVSLNVQNVFVLTKYRGLDPEIGGGIDGSI